MLQPFSIFTLHSKAPIEILHTVLLGPVKYVLSATIQSLSQEQKDQLHTKISSTDMSAFPATIRGNITQSYGSYVGRDFMQLAVVSEKFCLFGSYLVRYPTSYYAERLKLSVLRNKR